MGKPAARLTDMHVCPMVTPGVPPVPHVGGPITGPGCPTVLIGGMPAAVMGDMCVCTGPPDTIILGSTGVLIGGKPAARMGDQCAHGGVITLGCPTVLIGETTGGGGGGFSNMPVNVMLKMMDKFPPQSRAKVAQKTAFVSAAATGAPYVPETKNTVQLSKALNPAKKEKVEKSEIKFTLKDIDGNPVKNEKYKVTLPDGSMREGKTDNNGAVHITGFNPGECKISFPDLHKDDWTD